MEALGDILAPYSPVIGKIASTVTLMQFLSGIFLLNDIRKQKSSDKYPVEPFLGGIVLSLISLKLGTIMKDEATINVNIMGIAINVVFLLVFYYYSSGNKKSEIWSKLGKATVFILGCLAYAIIEDPSKLEIRLGLLITGVLLALVGLPMRDLPNVIRKQSTEGMPFPIIFSGTIVSFLWFVYGISIKNSVVIYQNLLIFTLSAIQLSMFALYPGSNSNQSTKSTKSKKSPSPNSPKKKAAAVKKDD